MADLDQLSQIIQSRQRLGKTDETYLVDSGYRFLTDTYFPHTGSQLNTTGAINALGHKQSGTDTYDNYTGTPVLGAYRYINELGVALLTEQAVKSLSYAVLGAACATNAYLRNNSKVAVYNFSDAPMVGRDILDYTENREDIYRALCKYFGGGTALDLEDIMPSDKREKRIGPFYHHRHEDYQSGNFDRILWKDP